MRVLALIVISALTASPALAQEPTPIRASVRKAAEAVAADSASRSSDDTGKSRLFWAGLAIGVAGVTTSALGLTVFRTEDSSTGNAPAGTYQACVALRDSNPIYAPNQCDALKGKNLTLLWGGVALGGLGAALMIGGQSTSAALSPGRIGLFHHFRF
jgi:hypothetical protein